MTNYEDIIILIIKPTGEEIIVPSKETDYKHISAFKRLLEIEQNDNLTSFLNEKSNNITGFEISVYISSLGNIIFFHTDVHNSFNNVQRASIILPEEITIEQKQKLKELLENLNEKNFEIYLGKTYKKKRKVIYQKICYDNNIKERSFEYVKR